MISETKTCQNCASRFVIEPDDFSFYEKMQVPPPTFCPDCRLVRRIAWRNERMLYKRPCNAPGHSEQLISNYASDASNPVYDQEFWWSDSWDPLTYGRDYDFSRTFFAQFKDLLGAVPLPNLTNLQSVQSDYCNFTYQGKNCYLAFASDMNEDSAYLYHAVHCRNSLDLLGCNGNEYCYDALHAHSCYKCAHVYFSTNCIGSSLLYNCHNCKDCFGCVNLKNAKYNIFNTQYTKEEYEKRLRGFDIGSRSAYAKLEKEFWELAAKYPRRFANLIKCVNSSGDYLTNAKNCKYCFDIEGPIEDSKFMVYGPPHTKDAYDGYGVGENAERVYEVTSCGAGAQNVLFSPFVWAGHSCQYSHFCRGSSYLFGCVGLRSKEYCILNKQYSKEAYEALLPRIIEHMSSMPYKDAKGRVYAYGEFFPMELLPFAYNETIAQEYAPMTRDEAKSYGYRWREPDTKSYKTTINADNLPDSIKEATTDILQEVIACAHSGDCHHQCTVAFRLIPLELEFYKQMSIALPRLCSNCRHYERLEKRNPLKLWRRKCMCGGVSDEKMLYRNASSHFHGSGHCPNEFETSYAPDRSEIVYCEQCYQAEVA